MSARQEAVAQQQARAVRRGAGLFRLERGVLRVTGGDRVRWLDGMVSNDVAGLAPGPERSGCYAALLTRQGRIVADLQILLRGDAFWLETERDAVERVQETLERFVIADDVSLEDASRDWDRIGLEGPAAPDILEAACGGARALAADAYGGAPSLSPDAHGGAPSLSPDACADVEVGGVAVVAAAFGWSGAPARQLFAEAGSGERVADALRAAGAGHGLVEAGGDALEILRVEAGVPRLGAELDEGVLPAEARLARAVSYTKGCYTGQEVVARMESRGRVGHLLVGLVLSGPPPPEVGAEVTAGDRKVGDVTSACLSPAAGSIALGFVRARHAEPGTQVLVGGREARVVELPFSAALGAAAAPGA